MTANPYREAADMPEEPVDVRGFGMIGVPSFTLAAFGGAKPDCPMCTKWAPDPGPICTGKRTFWTKTLLCPDQPHFHPRCEACKHVWLMAPRTSKENVT